eukprot:COSAG01_NODE_13055_length_1643_cov_1.730570_1_plen_325_part_10
MCSEDDFKEIGIPKGPRIKLLRALTTQPGSAGDSGHSRAPRTPQHERPHLAPVGAGRVPADGARDLDDETRHVHRSLSHELIAGTPPVTPPQHPPPTQAACPPHGDDTDDGDDGGSDVFTTFSPSSSQQASQDSREPGSFEDHLLHDSTPWGNVWNSGLDSLSKAGGTTGPGLDAGGRLLEPSFAATAASLPVVAEAPLPAGTRRVRVNLRGEVIWFGGDGINYGFVAVDERDRTPGDQPKYFVHRKDIELSGLPARAIVEGTKLMFDVHERNPLDEELSCEALQKYAKDHRDGWIEWLRERGLIDVGNDPRRHPTDVLVAFRSS